ncbi:Hypothetical predicted protein, partial [Olea europaea subsp. europaea]
KTNVVDNFLDGGDVMLTVVSDVKSRPDEEWILDSACSHHICFNQNFFQTYETVQQGGVVMGNNQSYRIVGTGQVRFRLWSMTYEDLLSTNDPFSEPIPLPEMVDFLVDIWHDEGLFD